PRTGRSRWWSAGRSSRPRTPPRSATSRRTRTTTSSTSSTSSRERRTANVTRSFAGRRTLVASAKLPTPDELKAVGRQLGMTLSDADVAFFLETMGGAVAAYHAVEGMADPMPPVKYPRTPGYRPVGTDNPHNAWYYKSEVPGAPSGKLK